MRSHAAFAGVCAAAAALISGCASDGSGSGHVTAIDAASETSTTLQGANLAESDPSRVQGAGGDLAKITCVPDGKGRWSFSATLSNSSEKVAYYRVTVEVARRSTGVMLGQRSMYFDMQPKETRSIDFSNIAAAEGSGEDITCAHFVTVQHR